MNKQLWNELTKVLGNTSVYDCRCDEIGYLAWNNDNYNFKFNMDKGVGRYRQFGYGLQYYTTPKKCFDFWLNNDIIWSGHYLKSLNELSTINFQKNIENLNQAEIIQLIVCRNLGFTKANDTMLFKETINKLTEKLGEK